MYMYSFNHLCSYLRGMRGCFIPSAEKILALPGLLFISMECKALTPSAHPLWSYRTNKNKTAEEKKKIEEKEVRRCRGSGRREGMWEQTGWVVALVHEVNSAFERKRIHIPVLAPSPACQGAFMTWADTWNILSSLPKQRMCPVNVSIRRYSAEGGAGRIALPAMTTAWVSSCVSCVLSPASLKG